MFSDINLKNELIKTRKSSSTEFNLTEYYAVIEKEIQDELTIQHNLSNSNGEIQNLELSKLSIENIFDLQDIHKIAVKYRLRFLPSKHYKNDIPSEAVFKIKALAKKHQTEINKFKILAPAKALELEDENIDPLLFIPLTKNKFYLIHKWGKDLSWSRRIKVFPLQNLETIIFSVGILALITALITPTSLILSSADIDMGYWGYHRVAWFFFSFILYLSITTFICFSQTIYPSEYQWNKKTYN